MAGFQFGGPVTYQTQIFDQQGGKTVKDWISDILLNNYPCVSFVNEHIIISTINPRELHLPKGFSYSKSMSIITDNPWGNFNEVSVVKPDGRGWF